MSHCEYLVCYYPLNRIDPSGHEDICLDDGNCEIASTFSWEDFLRDYYGVTLTGEGWTEEEIYAVFVAVERLGGKFANELGGSSAEAFRAVYENMEFEMYDGVCGEGCWGRSLGAHKIRFYRQYNAQRTVPNEEGDLVNITVQMNTNIIEQLVIHELGHSFESVTKIHTNNRDVGPRDFLSVSMTSDRNGLALPFMKWQQSRDITAGEIYADMFIGWVYGTWNYADFKAQAESRSNWMNKFMPTWLYVRRGL